MEKASKQMIANLKKQKRENKFLLFLDNSKIIKDALASGKIDPVCILTSRDELPFSLEKCQSTVNGSDNAKIPILKVDQKTIEQFSGTVTGQHVICVAMAIPNHRATLEKSNCLVLDGLQDPGNVGTLIRTALAVGFKNVILIEGVNPTNDKLVRSTAGAIFSVNLIQLTRKEFVEFAKKNNLFLVCTDMNGQNIFHMNPEELKTPFGVVVGNEGQGVSKEVEKLCSKKVCIPMCEGIESLNAAVSGAIVMYQLSDFAKSEK